MYKLIVKRFIDAAHQLPDSEDLLTKQCCNLHGHTYLVEVEVSANDNSQHGMVVDFKKIKNVIDILDHTFINDVFKEYGFDYPSTAENIAKFYFKELYNQISSMDFKIRLCEGYKGEESSNWVIYE